jgi:uncharacterized membrane protein YedE/YeeE
MPWWANLLEIQLYIPCRSNSLLPCLVSTCVSEQYSRIVQPACHALGANHLLFFTLVYFNQINLHMDFLQLIKQPWPWYVAGPLIGLTVPLLLLLGNKTFGISSSLRHICAACFPGNISFFQYNWKKEAWNLFFAAGIIGGGWIAGHWLNNGAAVAVNPALAASLQQYGVHDFSGLVPADLFNWQQLLPGWFWHPLCRGLYFGACHYGFIQSSMALTGGYLLFYGGRVYDGQPYSTFYSAPVNKNHVHSRNKKRTPRIFAAQY